MQLDDLAGLGPAGAVACIRASVANGWQGLFTARFAGDAPAAAPRPHYPKVSELVDGPHPTWSETHGHPGG